MTGRWTPRWTERIFAEYRRKKHLTFAMSKDKYRSLTYWYKDILGKAPGRIAVLL